MRRWSAVSRGSGPIAWALLATLAATPVHAKAWSLSDSTASLTALIKLGRYADLDARARAWLAEADSLLAPDSVRAAALDFVARGDYLGGRSAQPGARATAERAVALKEHIYGPDHVEVAKSLSNLVNLLTESDQPLSARPYAERALAIRERALGPDHPDVATALHNLGNCLTDAGDFAGARRVFERAIAIRVKTSGAESIEAASEYFVLGICLRRAGDFAGARTALERVVAIRERVLGPGHPQVAYGLNSLGNVLWEFGDYAGALPLRQRALAIFEKALGPDHPDLAIFLTTLANTLRDLKQSARARPLHERALAIREHARGPNHPDVAQSLNNLALTLQDLGEYAHAESLYVRSVAIRERAWGPEHPEVARTLLRLGDLYVLMGDSASAARTWERTVALRAKGMGTQHWEYGLALLGQAEFLARSGQRKRALAVALDGGRVSERHFKLTARGLDERTALTFAGARSSGLDVALSLAADPRPNDSTIVRAWDALIRTRAMVLDEMAARHRALAETGDAEIDSMAVAVTRTRQRLARLAVQGPGDDAAQYRQSLDEAQREDARAESELAMRSAVFRRRQAAAECGLAEVGRALPAGDALVAYARYRRIPIGSMRPYREPWDSYIALVLRAGDATPTAVDLGLADTLETLVSRWTRQAAARPPVAGRARAEAACRAAGEVLRSRIWDPLATRLGGARRVLVVPDGAIHLVDFAALPVPGGRYLIEDSVVVHLLTAERDLVTMEGMHAGDGGLLALGAPAFDARPAPDGGASTTRGGRSDCDDFRSMRFAPLPGALAEVEAIAERWSAAAAHRPGDTALRLTGLQASESAFKRLAAGRRVLHLATHGFFLDASCLPAISAANTARGGAAAGPAESAVRENPLLRSGLALAGANQRAEAPPDAEDGVLTAEEVSTLDLGAAEWVVLSACETGAGEVRAGEGVLGLRRAFQIAGARTVIMSLRAVDDEAARHWMAALYEGRFAEGMPTSDAVQAAGRAVLRAQRAHGLSTHPYYWAGFVAAGDWR